MTEASRDSVQPPIAYVLLWFPLSSETFVFKEVRDLRELGLDIRVYTMYGKALKGCSKVMREYAGPVSRMGVRAAFSILRAFFRALAKRPAFVLRLARDALFRKTRNLEALAENTWCFFSGFLLAEKCRADGIGLIHSAWANGPATAAWVASRLAGIPFAFTGRAGDIYPQDGILKEKAAAALFIRVNNAANAEYLASFCPEKERDKVVLVYNGLTFGKTSDSSRKIPAPPYKILAVGRFARTKGFPELFAAMARLRREAFPIELTLVGDGPWRRKLLDLRERLGLESVIHIAGFVPNDQLARYMASLDLLVVPSVIHVNGDRDGIPNVIMEALSLGMPVIATDVCGIGEVIRDGETGFLTPQRDPAALANAIRYALEHGEAALTMGKNGQKLVAEMFDAEKNAKELKKLYLDALRDAKRNSV